nr:MAG TPA: hypothetical protein [Bacteriophage sp.]
MRNEKQTGAGGQKIKPRSGTRPAASCSTLPFFIVPLSDLAGVRVRP